MPTTASPARSPRFDVSEVLSPGTRLVAASVAQLRGYLDHMHPSSPDPDPDPNNEPATAPIRPATRNGSHTAHDDVEVTGGAAGGATVPASSAAAGRTGAITAALSPHADTASTVPDPDFDTADADAAGPMGATGAAGDVPAEPAPPPETRASEPADSVDEQHLSGAAVDVGGRQLPVDGRGADVANRDASDAREGRSDEGDAVRAVSPRLALSILGPIVLRYLGPPDQQPRSSDGGRAPAGQGEGGQGQPVGGFGPRALELLAFLAVHPDGVGRDAVVAALWPDADRRRPTNALNATLARMRAALRRVDPAAAALIRNRDGRYRLDSDLVTLDYWNLLVGAAHLADPDPQRRARACEVVIGEYRGTLAVDLTGEWLITLREATRRRYLEALTTLARLNVDEDPERTLGLLETARTLEPLTEALYRDIMWIQYRLGRPEAAAGTLALLEAQLGEIDAAPEPATLELAAAIAARTTLPELDRPAPTASTPTASAAAPGRRSGERTDRPGVA